MNQIVFEDSASPHFRLRDNSSEDKTLEELVRNPEDADVSMSGRGRKGGSGDDIYASRSDEDGSHRNFDDDEMGVDGSPGDKSNEDQPGLSPINNSMARH